MLWRYLLLTRFAWHVTCPNARALREGPVFCEAASDTSLNVISPIRSALPTRHADVPTRETSPTSGIFSPVIYLCSLIPFFLRESVKNGFGIVD